MAYIGKQPIIGNFTKLDAITVVNGQASYTMQNGGSNFTEYANVNQFLVSLNGILQSPTDSFTVSGSTITFASNLVTGDVIDHIIVLGNTLDAGVPSDNTVSLAKLTATGTKDATTFLRGDNTFAGAGITMVDNWRLSAAYTSGTGQNDITSNWERNDTSGTGFIGTGMTESSGIFSFPQTGIYLIHAGTYMVGQNANYAGLIIKTTTNNSTYSEQTLSYNEVGSATNEHSGVLISYIFDVTDISTHKVKLTSETAAAVTISGNTSADRTYFRFIRLGDT